jgi:peptidoglycan hydrolase-like protein with peptidoglycan-binding domain
VITFQSSKGLRADGLVGAQTWEALVENVVPREGQSGDAVYAAQKLLQYKFGYSIDLDGIFGPETSAAVLDFQSTHGLIPDGVVRAQTWQALIAIQP